MRLLLFALSLSAAVAADAVDLTVAAVQLRSSFDIERNADRIVAHLEELSKKRVKVAVFPECALTGYTTAAGFNPSQERIERAERRIASACAKGGIAAVVGSVHRTGPRAYNVAVVFNESGEVVERYGKLRLAGEEWATPGNHMALFELAGVKSTVIICHDERYPEFVRLPAIAGARVVYYISHESGMRQERKLAGYRAQMMARAVENQIFAVAANAPANIENNSGSHGQSRIIADDGNILKEASFYEEDVLVETVRVKAAALTRPLEGFLSGWWKQGLAELMSGRNRPLD